MNAAELMQQVTSLLTSPGRADLTRLLGDLIARIADGVPITRGAAANLVGCDESDLDAHLAGLPLRVELDDSGRIVGAGLTLRPTRHRFDLDGKRLFTWCALDALIFPVVLGRTAEVSSPCAATGHPVSVTVSPEGILAASPSTAVVSVVAPEANSTDVRQSFCVHVNFFESAEAAQSWSGERPDAAVLSLSEAFDLAASMAKSFGQPGAKACGPETC